LLRCDFLQPVRDLLLSMQDYPNRVIQRDIRWSLTGLDLVQQGPQFIFRSAL
jgi:hypothetical protein